MRLVPAFASLVFLAAPLAAEPDVDPADMQRARNGNIAIQEELDAARKAATVAAYDLFLARHPDHPLAKVAREERQRLIDEESGRKLQRGKS